MLEPTVFLNGIFDDLATLDRYIVRGIFDEEFQPILEAEGRAITFTVSRETSRLSRHGTRLELGDRQFEVIGIQPIDDGQYADLILLELDPLPVLTFANIDPEAIDNEAEITPVTINGDLIFINNDLVFLGA
ncbi:MAG: hypothetical protein ACO3EZ_11775 [Prochlorotrichaceae cyanobacterium]